MPRETTTEGRQRGTATAPLVFVHSPLVGPSSWRRVADVAIAGGRPAVVVDVTGVADHTVVDTGTTGTVESSWADWIVDTVAAGASAVGHELVLVGHSGAGVFLPAIADRLAEPCVATVFVDAVVPPTAGHHTTSAGFAELLDAQSVDGRLHRWLDWWADDVVARIVPDPADRELLRADMPHLPRAFYDDPVAVPDGWSGRANAYVQLSDAYDADADVAAGRGWPVEHLDGTHLSIVTDPAGVLQAIDDVLSRLSPAPGG